MVGAHGFVRRVVRTKKLEAAALTSGAAEDFAKAYVAGAAVDEAAVLARRLISQGLLVSLAYLPLGEDDRTADMLGRVLETLGTTARGAELSVKPSALGSPGDDASMRRRLEALCDAAGEHGAHVTLEMEGVAHFSETLALWRAVATAHPMLGLTMPADVRRCEREILPLARSGARLRLCVGAYPVPRELGYRTDHDRDLAWVRLLRRAMENGAYAMVATHHPTLIAIAQDLARRCDIPPEGFEFQMFHGVRPLEHRRLADIGYQSRTYIPFGPGWFEYLTSRIVARPRTLIGYLRAIRDKR